jgi:threonine dehydrogenase-like Zn-dependent dehydrogenase
VIFRASPVGLMAVLSARIQGASQIFIVDGQADRLALAEQLGASRTALGENDHCQAPSLTRRCLRATLRAGRGCNHAGPALTLDAPTRRSIE